VTVDFNQYQVAANRTAREQSQLEGLVHAGEGLCSETGEYVSEIKRMHQYGKALSPEIHSHLIEELGDILWYVALACTHLEVPMHAIARHNIMKLEKRFPEKFSAEAAEARADKGGVDHRES
jgi:NTP pyrophosphatase (non-canonical NTP hydrolase)